LIGTHQLLIFIFPWSMKKDRIIIINKSPSTLFVEYKRWGYADIQKLKIKRRTVLKLEPGRHEIYLGYLKANLVIKNGMKWVNDIEEIPSIADNKYKGFRLLVHDQKRTLKIRCNESFSVAGLIEQLS
jgi:hypothetical protein